MSKRSLRKLRGVCLDALRAASLSNEFIAFWAGQYPFLNDLGLERLSRETLRVLSRHRTGARVALQQRPALLRDGSIVRKMEPKSIIEFNLHRDFYRPGVKLLTINKERT